jgi:hypothetical protein
VRTRINTGKVLCLRYIRTNMCVPNGVAGLQLAPPVNLLYISARGKESHPIIEVADEVSPVVLVSGGTLAPVAAVSEVPAREFLRLRPATENSEVRGALASDQSNRTYHWPYRAAG